jgi:hypothetical protein
MDQQDTFFHLAILETSAVELCLRTHGFSTLQRPPRIRRHVAR